VSGKHVEHPVTPEQAQLARGLIAEWFAAEADKAEIALIKAAAAVNKVKDELRAWQDGTPLTEMQVILCKAAQSELFQQAAQRFLSGAGDRAEVEGLRVSYEVLSRYLDASVPDDNEGVSP
jgi:hypothetical protein